MPIIAPPNQGYSDWQRTVNWDGPLLDSGTHLVPAFGTTFSSVLNLQRYSFIAGEMINPTGYMTVDFIFYMDEAMTVRTGRFSTALNSGMGTGMLMHIPCLGPFCQYDLTDTSGAPNQVTSQMFATNRAGWSPFNLGPGGLIAGGAGSIGASSAVIDNAPLNYGGPATLGYALNSGNGSVYLETLDLNGNWDIFYASPPITSTVQQIVQLTIPSGPVRSQMNNLGGATAYSVWLIGQGTSGL